MVDVVEAFHSLDLQTLQAVCGVILRLELEEPPN